MNDNSLKIVEVDIDDVLPNRFQPRIQFNENEILELSDSIKEHGVIQPLVVRPVGDKYEIIAGERRYKASVLAGKETVPVVIRDLNDRESAEVALIENVQRKNLTPIEEALSYKNILDMGYLTQEELAEKLGKSQPSIANKIRLLNLSDEVQEALLNNKISERHARSLLRLKTNTKQNEMLDRIINERLTVRRTDEEIDKIQDVDDTSDSEEKIIEKGEDNMNNNIQGMPSIPQQPEAQPSVNNVVPNFDIFGTQTPQQPVNNPTQSFDIFGTQPEAPSTPVVEPVMPTITTESDNQSDGTQFNFGPSPINVEPEVQQPILETPSTAIEQPTTFNFEAAPSVDSVVPEQPSFISTPQQPVDNNADMLFGLNNNVTSETQTPVQPIEPAQSEIPNLQPIIEQPQEVQPEVTSTPFNQESDNVFSFGSNEPQPETPAPEPSTIPEFKMPEPIIITDYSKQYDPVMPPQYDDVKPVVDFKEVINAIRDCSAKIEQYGFKIDVEEYDLSNMYQVIFKIEK